MINLAMGMTSMRTWTFYWVSHLVMLAGTVVSCMTARDWGSLGSLGSCSLLSPCWEFSAGSQEATRSDKTQKDLLAFQTPRKFDRNVIVTVPDRQGW